MKKFLLFLLILICWPLSIKAQTTLNSVYYTSATGATSMTLPGGVPSTKGNVLAIAIDTASQNMVITGATDNKGNNWVVGPGSVDTPGGTTTYILRTTGLATAGVTSITVNSTSPCCTINVYLYDISITASSYTVTSNFLSNQGTTTTPVGPSITPTGAGIIISIIAPSTGGPHSVASPFTLANSDAFSAYYLNTSASTISPNWTIASGTWDATILSIVPGGSGACPSASNMDGGVYAAPTTCYYVDFASGSDSNTGTTEGAPWQHAPGMAGATGVAASTTLAAGNGVIFKGGVTWTYAVLPWAPGVSGSTSGNDAYGGCTGANCIYFGVDKSWFAGGSWVRPIISGGDWSTAPTGSGASYTGGTCFYDVDASGGGNRVINLINQHDIIVDNFEFKGACLQEANNPPGGNNPSYISTGGSMANVTMENNYFHRPAYNIGSSSNNAAAFDVANGGGKYHFTFNVIDWSDAGPVTTFISTNGLDGFACCAGLGGNVVYTDHNVFYYMGAAEDEIGITSRNNNLFENANATVFGGGFHEHISNDGSCSSGQTITNYNNVIISNHTVAAAQNYGFTDNAACTFYVFGDVATGIAPPYYAYATGANGNTFHFFNVTMEAQDSSNGGPGSQIFTRGGGSSGTDFVGNLHIITGASSCSIFNIGTGSGSFAPLGTWTTSHGTTTNANFNSTYPGCPLADIPVQTQSVANGQGYTISQTYMFSPTSSGNATVGVGVNHTSDCNAIASSNAATASADAIACQHDTTYAVTYNQTNHTAVASGRSTVSRPTSGAWDAGAFQFSSSGETPAVTFSPTSLTFSSQIVSTTSSTQTVTLTNSGTATLILSSNVTTTGTNSGDFAISGSTCTNGATIIPSSTCTFSVSFTPSASGSRTTSWTVSDNASGSPQTGALTGTGVTGPVVTFSPTSIPFGNQVVSTTSSAQSVTLTNTGGTNLVLSSTLAVSGTNAGDFSISSNTCTNTTTITPSSTCTFSVAFTPSAVGSRSAIWTVSDNATGSPQTGTLTGTGLAPGTPAVTFSPTSLSFGSVPIGNASSPLTVLMENTGTANLVLSSAVTFTGTNASDFSLSGSSTCINGATVSVSSSCTIIITFTPGALGSRSASWTVSDNASGSPHTGALSGTGTAPGVSFSPTSLTFGSQIVSTTSATQTVTLTNSGTANLLLSSNVTTTGTNSADFAISSSTCTNGTTVLPGNTCTFAVAFTPSAIGSRTASWTVSDNASGSPQTGALSGIGISSGVPGVVFAPTSLSFSSQVVSTTSPTQTVTLTNSGTANLILSSNVTLAGTNAADYAVSGSTCTNGATITPSSTCVFSVAFTPSATGTRTANWTISDNASGSPQTGTLTGNGITSVLPAPGTVMFAAIPLPVQVPEPTISSVIPLQPYVTAKGCSEDGVTWNKNCPVRLICNGCNSTTKVTFDGKSVAGTYKTGEIDVNIPLSMLAASSIPVQHVFSMSNPLAVVQVVQ